MSNYTVGYFVGSLSTSSLNRPLAKGLVRLVLPAPQLPQPTATGTVIIPGDDRYVEADPLRSRPQTRQIASNSRARSCTHTSAFARGRKGSGTYKANRQR